MSARDNDPRPTRPPGDDPRAGDVIPPLLGGWKTESVKVELTDVNPELLDIIFGGQVTASTTPEFSLEVWSPIKRRWWQRLLRRPVRYRLTYLPRVAIDKEQP